MEHQASDGVLVHREGVAPPASFALVAILLGAAGGAWLLSARLATPEMRLGVLTRAPAAAGGGQMGMSDSMSMGMSVFIATWTVMMVAMMVPSVLPAVRTFDTQVRTRRRSRGATALFVAGYLLVWGAIGGVAYLVVQALQDWFSAGSMSTFRVGAVLLVVAGLYQLAPLKRTCLRHCRSPYSGVTPLVGKRALGYQGAVHAGLRSGVYCLGSSWPLMLVLLLVGMMNLGWMAVIAGVIFIEKVVPGGVMVSKAVGCGCAGWGVVLLTAPYPLPALGGG